MKSYSGDDLFSGNIGNIEILFSEIHAKYKPFSLSGIFKLKTLFEGLFFVADFNKHFHGQTLILPDNAEKIFGFFGAAF